MAFEHDAARATPSKAGLGQSGSRRRDGKTVSRETGGTKGLSKRRQGRVDGDSLRSPPPSKGRQARRLLFSRLTSVRLTIWGSVLADTCVRCRCSSLVCRLLWSDGRCGEADEGTLVNCSAYAARAGAVPAAPGALAASSTP